MNFKAKLIWYIPEGQPNAVSGQLESVIGDPKLVISMFTINVSFRDGSVNAKDVDD